MIQALLVEGDRRTQLKWPDQKDQWEHGDGVLWLDIQGADSNAFEELGKALDLNDAIVRACSHPEHRARLREFRNHLLLVVNAVGRGVAEKEAPREIGRWRTLELNIVVGDRLILTAHPEAVPAVTTLYRRYSKTGEGKPTVPFLLFSLCESLTSGYYLVLDRLDKLIDETENEIFGGDPSNTVVDHLFALKRHILYLRRVLGPQRDAFGALMRREFPMLPEDSRLYFVETFEHTLRLFDLMDTYRDLISSSLDAYLSTVSNRMNEVMKTLTIVSTIMLPLTLITGIFGMNFVGIPFLNSPWGIWGTMAVMLLIGVAMAAYFKRRRWM